MEFLRKSKFTKPAMFIVAGLAVAGIAAPLAMTGINDTDNDRVFNEAVAERQAAFDEYNAAYDAYQDEVFAAYDTANLSTADDPIVVELTDLFEVNDDGESTLEPRLTVNDPPKIATAIAEIGLQADQLRYEAQQLNASRTTIEDLTEQVVEIHERLTESLEQE